METGLGGTQGMASGWSDFCEWIDVLGLTGLRPVRLPMGPAVMAHGRVLAAWIEAADAPAIRFSRDERAFLIAADPETFFILPEYLDRDFVMLRPARMHKGWVQANLMRSWRALAPVSVLELVPGDGPADIHL